MSVSRTRIPWLTAGFVAVAAAASVWPDGVTALGYQREAAEAGELWRALTGQLVHGSPIMAVVDLGAVLFCGAWLERRARGVAASAGAFALLLVAATVHATQPQVLYFEGSSGVAAGLFTAAALQLARTAESRAARALSLGVVGAAVAKAMLEQWVGWGAAGLHPTAGIPVLGAAHLAGSAAGLCAVALVARLPSLRPGAGSQSPVSSLPTLPPARFAS